MQKIASAFMKAQTKFAPALKTATNPHFRSKYVALDGVIEAVIDALHENGIALMQKNHDVQGGVGVETVFIHESGETLSGGVLFVPADKQNPQGYGSALTYARRYSLMASCGIAPEDDDGNQASIPAKQKATFDINDAKFNKLGACTDLASLKTVYTDLYKQCPDNLKSELEAYKNEIKSLIEGKA